MVVEERIRVLNGAPVRPDGAYVVYWAGANRRVESNHGPARAVEIANELALPVLYYEGVTCAYPHANGRLHTFLLEGVPETARRLKRLGIGYCFSLRRRFSDPEDAFFRVAERAACVVADDNPACFPALLNATVPEMLRVRYEVVDSSCIVPMNLLDKREYAACTACRDALETMIRIHGRARPGHVHEHPVVLRAARPAVAGAGGIRDHPLHAAGGDEAQEECGCAIAGDRLPGADWN